MHTRGTLHYMGQVGIQGAVGTRTRQRLLGSADLARCLLSLDHQACIGGRNPTKDDRRHRIQSTKIHHRDPAPVPPRSTTTAPKAALAPCLVSQLNVFHHQPDTQSFEFSRAPNHVNRLWRLQWRRSERASHQYSYRDGIGTLVHSEQAATS
jgi:hypothetical protein